MLRINRFFFTIIQILLFFDSTKESHVRQAIKTVKAIGKTIKSSLFKQIGNTIKKPIIKTFDNTIKNSLSMFRRNKNAIKNVACNLQEKHLGITHNFGSKPVKYLGLEAIKKFKYMAPWAARGSNRLVRASGKKNIYMRSAAQMSGKDLRHLFKRSAEYMPGKELRSLINMVSKSKPQLPFLAGGGLMKLTKFSLVPNNDNASMDIENTEQHNKQNKEEIPIFSTKKIGAELGKRTNVATAGQITSQAKIGGPFTQVSDGKAEFLSQREAIFNKQYQTQQEKLNKLDKKDITITLPDGTVKYGKSFETTPFDIASGISSGLAREIVGASVLYKNRQQGLSSKLIVADDHEEMEKGEEVSAEAEIIDVTRPFEGDCNLELFKFDSKKGQEMFWHSSSHLLGQALENNYGAQLTHGPPISAGFFYDCYMGDNIIDQEQYKNIESKVNEFVKKDLPFERLILTKEDALKIFANNPFKIQLINSKIPDGAETTAYKCGNLVDLCTGPHIPRTGLIKAFKIMKNSSAYWLGKQQNDNLQRVYGVSFPRDKLLKAHTALLDELEEKKHQNLGAKQKLFYFNKQSPGSAFWAKDGARIYQKLQEFIMNEYKYRGFENVITPNIYKKSLWKTSGHYFKYAKDMYFIKDNEETFGQKPMNCPGHCLLFKEEMKSYKDLPLRFSEFGVLHRNEGSGSLNGLTRVRRFCQDDAHIFVREDQIEAEVKSEQDFSMYIHEIFGIETNFYLSTRPENRIGEESLWNLAESSLESALKNSKLKYSYDVGGGAYYGPKIDIKIKDVYGREHQIATVQLDFTLPERFNLQYQDKVDQEDMAQEENKKGNKNKQAAQAGDKKDVNDTEQVSKEKKLEEWELKALAIKKDDYAKKDAKDKKDMESIAGFVPDIEKEEEKFDYDVFGHLKPGFKRPIIIHRAHLGSVERFTAIIAEHFGGKWPFWQNPKQAQIIPISPKFSDYAKKVHDRLRLEGFDVDMDLGTAQLKKKIRTGHMQKYNFILCCGEKEVDSSSMTVRTRELGNKEIVKTVPEILQMFNELLPESSAPKKKRIANAFYTPDEIQNNQNAGGSSEFSSSGSKLNEELRFKTFLKGDGLEFSELDKEMYDKLKDLEVDKNLQPNLYRWKLMIEKLISSGS